MSKVLKGFQENFSRQNQNSNVASGSSHQATLNNEPGPMDVDVHHEYLDVDMVPPPMPPAPPPKSPTPPPHPPTPPPPIEWPRGLPPRVIRLPQRFRDEVPPKPPLIIPPVVEEEPPQPQEPPSVEMSDSPNIAKDPADSLRKASEGTPMALPSDWFLDSEPKDNKSLLFKNRSTQLIMSWFYNGHGTKSYADTDKLIHQVVLDPDFDPKDFDSSFSTAQEAARLDEISTQKNSTDSTLSEGSFSIPVPCDGFIFDSEEEAPQFVVENVMYQKPLEVIKQAFAECTSETYTTIPYREFWRPSPDEPPKRLFSESYVADIFNEEYEKIKSEPRIGPHRHLEPFVVGIGIFSDSTHLTSFGDASIWPILMYILNQSKYTRGKPKEFAAHHIAYIPKLTDTFQDWHQRQFGKAATSEMLTHMRCEVNTGVWGLLLDEDVKRAYAEGEAVELADRVGSKMDMRNRLKLARVDSKIRQFDIETAHKALFLGKKINSKAVNGLLQQTSAFPIRNAFSKALFEYGFNFYRMFTANRVEIRKLLCEDRELLEPTPPDLHYHISSDDFMLRLKTHLYARLSGVNEFSDSIGTHERLQITIFGDRIYEHQVLRINYTSYDMCRIQDTLKPNSSRCDIMVLASNKGADQQVHLYWYARIIGIYHANVVISTPDDYYRASKHKVDFLHVRWLGVCEDCHYGWKYRRLPQLVFGDINDSASFGFVDPSLVIRATHLIPRFILGKIPTLGLSVAYRSKENNEGEEWERYYVNFFVDRDMVMLYRGGGVGHASTRAATNSLRQDRRADDIASRKKRREAHEAPDPDLEPDGASDQEQDAQDQAKVAPENSADSDDNEDDSDQHTDSEEEEEEEEESDEDEDRGDLDELGFAEY
ncbi:hypothetical protein JR316_0005135 [Psilocybe cubensis]|uniref:Uncharacterized protein n=1 Tax=Psilocybe cubensis TaxID=181762 RepID=A0ACB8H783_PSICU|nr:hypothetical protein JR316_0005135 [Psilocybe cubensis]KAH9483035.1 hypothetical protein JR316_0005135 [Psilocybe cubensis]